MQNKFSRTRFFNQNIINGQLENDLPSNNFNNFQFKRPRRYYTLQQQDTGRPEFLAYKFYGNTSYYWIICKLNNIDDVYNDMESGKSIQLPSAADIEEFYLNTRRK